ncbi:MAG TPA: hypothetical protein VH370_18680 [Humisphaera sp.]|nr:hypothetical protein [Humisphaera sp.]
MASSARGALPGSAVSGVLNLPGFTGPNFFDPANHLVPPGFENSSSATVNISVGQSEFGYQDSANFIVADFGSTTFLLSDFSTNGSAAQSLTFTDSAFSGLSLVKTNDTYPGGVTASLSGNTITLSTALFTSPGNFNAQFTLQAVPEPASLCILGCAGFLLLKRRRH